MLKSMILKGFDFRLDEARFDEIFGDLPLGGFLVQVDEFGGFRYRAINKWLERHLGVAADAIVDSAPGGLPGGTDPDLLTEHFNECVIKKSRVVYEDRFRLADGLRHFAVSLAPVTDSSGEVRQIVGIVVDMIERRRAENALRHAERRYRRLFDNAIEGIFQSTPEGWFISANPAMARIFGFDSPKQMIGEQSIERQLYVNPDRRESFMAAMERDGQVIGFEYQARRRDGQVIWVSTNVHTVRDEDGELLYYEGTVHDVTWRKEAEERIQFLAQHDSLTDLPNRSHFREHLEVALAQAERSGKLVGLMMLDIDHFKIINDTLGHAAGDELLEIVALRLRECVRGGDVVSRLGGDEFAIIQNLITGPGEAALLADRIMEAIKQPLNIREHEVHTGISVGITVYPDDHSDMDQLLKNADMALYRAKAEGPSSFQFYSPDMRAQAEQRLTLTNGLRQALAANEFLLHYQPKIGVASQQIIGLEALLRWHHPQLGFIPPGEFVPFAEESGLILPIGEWVLHEVCSQVKRWQVADQLNVPVAINLSATQFKDRSLVDKIVRTLDQTSIPPEMIELEITESALMHDTETAIQTLERLVGIGVRISIDDFGTGYSSLNYLRRFPVEKLKIDKTFVNEVGSRAEDAVIARAIINLGHSLGIRVVAEGVETEQQADFLGDHGCDEIQGYYYSKPLPADGFVNFARAHKAKYDA